MLTIFNFPYFKPIIFFKKCICVCECVHVMCLANTYLGTHIEVRIHLKGVRSQFSHSRDMGTEFRLSDLEVNIFTQKVSPTLKPRILCNAGCSLRGNPRTFYFLFFSSSIDNKPAFLAVSEQCVLTELPPDGNFKSSFIK